MENQESSKKKNSEVINLIKKINTFLSIDKPSDILIIKSHLLCEYYVNQILILREICLIKEMESLTFFQKIQKAFDMNQKEEKLIFDYVNRLNKLRNKVGHELEYTLSESDVDSLGFVKGKEYILEKYEHETDTERLRSILEHIVIEVALLLINNVRSERKKLKTEDSTSS